MPIPQASQKKSVNLSLDPALVQESRSYCGNLSAKVEELLQAYVGQQRLQNQRQRLQAQTAASHWNAVHDAKGSYADEHCTR